jgi:hypothetical protein
VESSGSRLYASQIRISPMFIAVRDSEVFDKSRAPRKSSP